MSSLPTHRIVNGLSIPLTPQEIIDITAEWEANKPDPNVPVKKTQLQVMQETIDNLTTQLATLQALPSIQSAATAAGVTLTPVPKI